MITDADEVVVAKVNATSKWNSKFVAEVAAGVDTIAIMLLGEACVGSARWRIG